MKLHSIPTLVLASALGLVVIGASVAAHSPADDHPARWINDIVVRPADVRCVITSLEGPEISEVRAALAPCQEVPAVEHARSDAARKALEARYGSRITESAVPPHYEWWWNAALERWEIVCITHATFEVDFGARGSILVESRDSEVMEKHRE